MSAGQADALAVTRRAGRRRRGRRARAAGRILPDQAVRRVAAADGRAAQAAILKEPARYGLVLTDLQLPGVDGLGVLRTVKQANPSAYVVIITGYASLDSAIQAVRLGAYDYLTKPFSLGQIDVVLQRVRDRVALEAENRRLSRQVSQREGVDARARRSSPASRRSKAAWAASRPCCATAATRAIASADPARRGRPCRVADSVSLSRARIDPRPLCRPDVDRGRNARRALTRRIPGNSHGIAFGTALAQPSAGRRTPVSNRRRPGNLEGTDPMNDITMRQQWSWPRSGGR